MIEFFVPGVPRPGGSKRAFLNKHTGKANLVDASGEKGKDWRGDAKIFARQAYKGSPLEGPLTLEVTFWMPRPKGHYGSGRNSDKLKESAPMWPVTKPDSTKLIRSLEDALTGLIWIDDAQVVLQVISKEYASKTQPPGATVQVSIRQAERLAPSPCNSE